MSLHDASKRTPFWFWLAQDPASSEEASLVAGPFSYDGSRISEVGDRRPPYLQQRFGLPPEEVLAWIRGRAHGGKYDNGWRDAEIVECVLRPDQRYARMARPCGYRSESRTPALPAETVHEVHRSTSQLLLLCERLATLFHYVHPDGANLSTYGLEARNIIILAATEVEVQLRAVLAANGADEKRPTMNDFVKLSAPMFLDSYSILFSQCPWVPAVSPFVGWEQARPSQSMDWYDAYNSVKHDRELNMTRSTLLAAMTAVGACYAVLLAQFGFDQIHVIRPDLDRHLSPIRSDRRYSLKEENSRGIYVSSAWPSEVQTLRLF